MNANSQYFCSESIKEDLKGKTVRGGVATALAQAGGVAIQLISIPIIARLLNKDDIGLVAMATFFTGFAAMFVDAGMAMATVQRSKITHLQVSNLFWLSSMLGAAMMLLTAAMSPAIAWFYNDPRVGPITATMGVAFLFAGMATQHKALLTRSMDFRSLAAVGLLASLGSQAVAILIAWRYQSYWALALRQVALGLFTLIGMWAACRWIPSLPRRRTDVRPMIGFGASLTGFNFLNYFARNADNLFIGKMWGEGQLGLYDMAYKLFMMPMRNINGPLQAVAVPALSRLTREPKRYREFYLGMVRRLTLLTIPLAVFLSAASDLVIPALLDDGWEGSIPILRALSIAGVFSAIGNTFGWLYVSQGRGAEMLRLTFVTTPIILLAMLLGLQWGALGVAWTYTVVIVVFVFPYAASKACRSGPVHATDIYRMLVAPLTVGAGVVVGIVLAKLAMAGRPVIETLVVAGLFSATLQVAITLAIPRTRRDVILGVAAMQKAWRKGARLAPDGPGVGVEKRV